MSKHTAFLLFQLAAAIGVVTVLALWFGSKQVPMRRRILRLQWGASITCAVLLEALFLLTLPIQGWVLNTIFVVVVDGFMFWLAPCFYVMMRPSLAGRSGD